MATDVLDLLRPRKTGWQLVRESVSKWSEEFDKPTLEQVLRDDPCRIYAPLRIEPDPWQREVLTCSDENVLLLCSRQAGKSQTMSVLALKEALTYPYSEVLIVSRSLRQSVELLRKVKELWRGLTGGKVHKRGGFKPRNLKPEVGEYDKLVDSLGWDGAALIGEDMRLGVKEKALSHDFPNGSRITSLPGNPDTIVGFSAVTMLLIDEASRVSDSLMSVARPFLTVTKEVHGRPGRTIVASTPFGKRGWFYDAWFRSKKAREEGKTPPWKVMEVTADQCPRIPKEFLAKEREELGDRWYAQEYFCEFRDAVDSVFSHDLIQSMLVPTEEPPFKLWFQR